MKPIPILLTATLLSFFCCNIFAQENQFLKMAKEPYANYCGQLQREVYVGIELHDSHWAAQTATQMREAAKISKNKKWLLEADYFELAYKFGIMRLQKPNKTELDSFTYIHINNLQKIVQRAKKIKAADIELRAMFSIWSSYTFSIQNDEMSFRYGMEFDKALSTVAAKEFPDKLLFYTEIAKRYHHFREFEKAKLFFEKILEEPEVAHQELLLVSTWNELGLIYRYHYNDLDKSDFYFRKILEAKPDNPEQQVSTANKNENFTLQDEYELWIAIAKGNLGNNCYLRGDYNNAIPLLEYSVEKVVENNTYNYPYAVGKAIILSEIFIIQSDFSKAKRYADKSFELLILQKKAYEFEGMTNDNGLWMQYYNLMNRYYRALGNSAQAFLYADSSAVAQRIYEEEFNLRKLHRAEQYVQEEKHVAEKKQVRAYLISALGGCLLLVLALGIWMYYSRTIVRKNRDLYLQIKEQDRLEEELDAERRINLELRLLLKPDAVEFEESEDNYELFFGRLVVLMKEQRLFANLEVKRKDVAKEIGISDRGLHDCIKKNTGMSFAEYINALRLAYARELLSNMDDKHTIETIAFEAGFNSRPTFYRLFTEKYGLSPKQFRKLSKV